MEPRNSQVLLASKITRDLLSRRITKRLQRRNRELNVLQSILLKLNKMSASPFRPRRSLRVEVDMPVRLMKNAANIAHKRHEEEEEVFDNVQYFSGRLKDISEGGACLHTEMMAESSDLIKISSASPDILLPPLSAVLSR